MKECDAGDVHRLAVTAGEEEVYTQLVAIGKGLPDDGGSRLEETEQVLLSGTSGLLGGLGHVLALVCIFLVMIASLM